jgi:drug/metabolite transporter (DMT)-like permease
MKVNLIFIILLIALASTFDTIRELLNKSAINRLDINVNSLKKVFLFIVSLLKIPRVWFAFLLSTASLCVWLFVVSKTDLNLAFSLDSMHYIFIAIASRIFLKEKVGLLRWVGTFLIIAGIVLVTLS